MRKVRVGIGGWSYAPWRDTFYPKNVPRTGELAYAAGRLGAIEINATYHKLQTPGSFAAWAKAVPDDFVFTVKGSRFCTNRKVLADAGEGMARFLNQGLVELGPKLGAVLWQFMGTKRFDPDDFGGFLKLLPASWLGVPLRHAVEVRHESFVDPTFVTMARAAGVAICWADKAGCPTIDEDTAGFRYARLQRAEADVPTGYAPDAVLATVDRLSDWAERGDAFVFVINGAKERAPAAALALIEALHKRGLAG